MYEYFVARQPIFNRNVDLFAYELLVRNSEVNIAPSEMDDEMATAQVLATSDDVGLANLVGNNLAFINLPARFLLEPELLPFDPQGVVLEVLESVELSDSIIHGMQLLSNQGYRIALDDIIQNTDVEAALPFVYIVKLDIPRIPPDQWESEILALKSRGVRVLAEKVETEEEFQTLLSLGCDYFQGYFFAQPKIVSGRRLPPNKLAMLELLSRINQPDIDIDELNDLVCRDVALSVRVMNYTNSAASALTRRVESIREAVVYVGRENIRRWVTLLALARIDDKPTELMTMSLVRAKFLELLADCFGDGQQDAYFTVGMFSLLDALLDLPIDEALATLGLATDLERAIAEKEGEMGEALNIAIAIERGAFGTVSGFTDETTTVARMHRDAIRWADETLTGVTGS